jgi:hypothetical protein
MYELEYTKVLSLLGGEPYLLRCEIQCIQHYLQEIFFASPILSSQDYQIMNDLIPKVTGTHQVLEIDIYRSHLTPGNP